VKQRIITGILFTLAIALFVIPGYWFSLPLIILFAAVALLASREILQALRNKGLKPNGVLASAGSLLMLLPLLGSALFRNGRSGAAEIGFTEQVAGGFALMSFVLLAAMFFTVIGIMIKRGPDSLPDAVATAAIMGYVAFPLSCPVLLTDQVRGGFLWLLVGLTAPWISDSFAYFTGSLLGRHPIIPSISPKKTLEGCLGGMAGCMLVMPLVFVLFGHTLGTAHQLNWISYLFAAISGLVLSVASQFGDWLASGVKRWCGVKDFGKILPGHGGIMDRFDSAFFTLPMVLILAVLYQIIQSWTTGI
jgi:phosphatidate cytidylyltransferase